MATEIEYALMAGRAYQSTRAAINLLPDLQGFGWTEFSSNSNPAVLRPFHSRRAVPSSFPLRALVRQWTGGPMPVGSSA